MEIFTRNLQTNNSPYRLQGLDLRLIPAARPKCLFHEPDRWKLPWPSDSEVSISSSR